MSMMLITPLLTSEVEMPKLKFFSVGLDRAEQFVQWSGLFFTAQEEREAVKSACGWYCQELTEAGEPLSDPIGPYDSQWEALQDYLG